MVIIRRHYSQNSAAVPASTDKIDKNYHQQNLISPKPFRTPEKRMPVLIACPRKVVRSLRRPKTFKDRGECPATNISIRSLWFH
ncbi:hypothetical protein DC094_20490 [Pelagibaculum spongiae]|uniref:Uncharacterized protein n=1 Tax=Pelagibaculum spongiae TaxID=2080658 RepID=A0A2V1GVG9_9GAMM|nr:hypothetical protein DC094_20490 [Pelagibaculum spongiae]